MYSQAVEAHYANFRHPFSCIIVGASMCGKTELIAKLIKHKDELICPSVRRIIFSYKKYQPIFDSMKDVEFVQGMNFTLNKTIPTLVVIDDGMLSHEYDKLAELFTVGCHHDNTSVVFVTQNLFFQNQAYRTASLNSQYFILFKSPRTIGQITHLARQMFVGERAKAVVRAYENATQKPFTYIILDFKPDTPESLRVRSNILPQEGPVLKGVHLSHCYRI
jgi:hypothetical protein